MVVGLSMTMDRYVMSAPAALNSSTTSRLPAITFRTRRARCGRTIMPMPTNRPAISPSRSSSRAVRTAV